MLKLKFKKVSAVDFYRGKGITVTINPLLKFYDITTPVGSQMQVRAKKDNIFLLAGEHPREMISAETMFAFVKFLCIKNDQNPDARRLLDNNNLRIIINANPTGRKKVESGQYCIRTNQNEVDINRNWDYFFGKDIHLAEENSGKAAFSEIETKFIRDAIESYNAKLFLTLHSGTLGLFHPYAYLMEEGK